MIFAIESMILCGCEAGRPLYSVNEWEKTDE